ncbi:PREDICTED: sister chromatid cohesion 1 protein 4-like [Nelumbo nucifera]|uniref:Sister chromatid cohesion 1 protein 4-like n=1 Tax=Nelumbo nucifera TaxID=4432 RepID=A0A1U7ZCS5_NELNU|nr:PREDICTED: sister chromatid cohesion 1 protein 4-like [Nelumbo nucifera]
MFYSQFILAKKGPLGTIWIAAHLERKLRKNQVADTDIGVSVDSILFPEAPIALRLSSHLLLGVVRIYSRKVNYLFHDCSEALLKVKQAFRSTAVDLPPEESTAPYHSITLPETFDLDDFELPDSAFFQSNYVDHHVSTREQITLQDTMDGVVYSTSQFGLDEQFGDGDTSQIGLDLDEDLFLNKNKAAADMLSLEDDVDLQASGQPMTPFTVDIDDEQTIEGTADVEIMVEGGLGEQIDSDLCDPMRADDSSILNGDPIQNPDQNEEVFPCKPIDCPSSNPSEELVECAQAQQIDSDLCDPKRDDDSSILNGDPIQNPDQNEDDFPCKPIDRPSSNPSEDLVECAQAPFTPGLMEESIQAKQPGDSLSAAEGMDHIAPDVSRTISSPTSVLVEQPKPVSPVSECSDRVITAADGQEQAEALQNGAMNNKDPTGVVNEACTPTCALPSSPDLLLGSDGGHELGEAQTKSCTRSQDSQILSPVGSVEKSCGCNPALQACSSQKNQSDSFSLSDGNLADNVPESREMGLCSHGLSEREEDLQTSGVSAVQGEVCQRTTLVDTTLETDASSVPRPAEDILENHVKLDGHLDNDMPAPETLLSVPTEVTSLPNHLLLEPTPEKETVQECEGSEDGVKILSGKKRCSMESTPALQSGKSTKLSGVPQSKRTVESIPDDDDLLSSILVGRRTSALKLRPTPPIHEVASSKRPRLATPRSSVTKRKVPLDDSMVLHGDTIRQQLTNTEDIRRVRRKAPCTHSEIWMIQKNLLEVEIFSEPIFTGIAIELIGLHNQTYDLTEFAVSQNDAKHIGLEAVKDTELSTSADPTNETSMEGLSEPVVAVNDGEENPHEVFVPTENQHFQEHATNSVGYNAQDQGLGPTNLTQVDPSKYEQLGEMTAMETDRLDGKTAESVAHNPTNGVELPLPTSPFAGDNCNALSDLIIESSSQHKLDDHSAEKDASVMDRTDGGRVDVTEASSVLSEGVSRAGDVSSLEEGEGGKSVDMVLPNFSQECNLDIGENSSIAVGSLEARYHLADSSTRIENGSPSSPGVFIENGEQTDSIVITGDGTKGGMEANESGDLQENELVVGKTERNDGIPSLMPISVEEPQNELNMEMQDHTFDGVENLGSQEANLKSTTDAEITALDNGAVRDSIDCEHTIDGNDTGFLNVDDDDVEDEEDNGMPGGEEAQFFDNSGWSLRTRAVARYLQTLFDNEAGHSRKLLSVDNLLAGKTRKEASRMFFETLVLKTRDYIHVEQGNPFDKIHIKPRVKLMKSEF